MWSDLIGWNERLKYERNFRCNKRDRENERLKWFGHAGRRNNDEIVKRVGGIRVEEIREGIKKKQTEIISDAMRAYGVDDHLVRGNGERDGKNTGM